MGIGWWEWEGMKTLHFPISIPRIADHQTLLLDTCLCIVICRRLLGLDQVSLWMSICHCLRWHCMCIFGRFGWFFSIYNSTVIRCIAGHLLSDKILLSTTGTGMLNVLCLSWRIFSLIFLHYSFTWHFTFCANVNVFVRFHTTRFCFRVSKTCGLRFCQLSWRTEMTFVTALRCCGVSVTPAPHINILTYLLTYLSVVSGLGWVHCVGVVGRVGLGA